MNKHIYAIAITTYIGLACTAYAQDTIYFKSGNSAEGKVISYSDRAFEVELPSGERRVANIDIIREIIFSEPRPNDEIAPTQPVATFPLSIMATKSVVPSMTRAEHEREYRRAQISPFAVAVTVLNKSDEAAQIRFSEFVLRDRSGGRYNSLLLIGASLDDFRDRILPQGADTGGWIHFELPMHIDRRSMSIRYESRDGNLRSDWVPVP